MDVFAFRKGRGGRTVAPVQPDDGVVSIGLPALIALHRAAQAMLLRPGRIRSPGGGAYRSPFKGRGMEFDEVRPYAQGDDARTLDWRVTARTGRPHTKLFREERERAVLIWVDLSRPMFFATQGAFKAVRAAQCAALIGWSATHQGDRVGGFLSSETSHVELRPRRGELPLLHFLRHLSGHPAWQSPRSGVDPQMATQAVRQSLARLRRVAPAGSLVVLLSDFMHLDEQACGQLVELSRHNELVVAGIHDPLEAELPPPGQYRISDGDRFLTLATGDPAQRERYRDAHVARRARLENLCRRHAMTWLPLSTAEHPLRALLSAMG